MARVTVDLISTKQFTLEPKGYSQQEVDNFLDDICEEMERMEAEIKDLRQKTTIVKPAADGLSAQDESSFREILEMAKKVKDDTIQKAKEDAEAIRVKAETEAQERLDGLSGEREALNHELDALREAVKNYRRDFEALLQAQQEALEKASDLF